MLVANLIGKGETVAGQRLHAENGQRNSRKMSKAILGDILCVYNYTNKGFCYSYNCVVETIAKEFFIGLRFCPTNFFS